MISRKAAIAALALSLSFSPPNSMAAPCAASDPEGTSCEAQIILLHPTQFNLGMIEVNARAKEVARMSPDKLDGYLLKHPAPLVVGPEGVLYLLDRHHLARAILQTGGERIDGEIKANWRDLAPDEFWSRMESSHWVWLYDDGRGPLSPRELPKTVLQMTDDPYRSLAQAVRDAGGYAKSSAPFAEFLWADYFRSRIPLQELSNDFKKAAAAAEALARAPAAENLPGYLGR